MKKYIIKEKQMRQGKEKFFNVKRVFVLSLLLIKYRNVFAILCKSWDLEMTDRKQKWETKEREIEICEECWDYNTQQHRKLGAIQMAAQETIDITVSIVFHLFCTTIHFYNLPVFHINIFVLLLLVEVEGLSDGKGEEGDQHPGAEHLVRTHGHCNKWL